MTALVSPSTGSPWGPCSRSAAGAVAGPASSTSSPPAWSRLHARARGCSPCRRAWRWRCPGALGSGSDPAAHALPARRRRRLPLRGRVRSPAPCSWAPSPRPSSCCCSSGRPAVRHATHAAGRPGRPRVPRPRRHRRGGRRSPRPTTSGPGWSASSWPPCRRSPWSPCAATPAAGRWRAGPADHLAGVLRDGRAGRGPLAAVATGAGGLLRRCGRSAPSADPERRAVLLLGGAPAARPGWASSSRLVPFHVWTPQAYAGGTEPVAAFLAATSKVAALAALLVVLQPLVGQVGAPGPRRRSASLAAVSMTVGNVAGPRAGRPGAAAGLVDRRAGRLGGAAAVRASTRGPPRPRAATCSPTSSRPSSPSPWSTSSRPRRGPSARRPGTDHGRTLAAYTGLLRAHPLLGGALGLALLSLAGLPPGVLGLVAKVVALRPVVGEGQWAARPGRRRQRGHRRRRLPALVRGPAARPGRRARAAARHPGRIAGGRRSPRWCSAAPPSWPPACCRSCCSGLLG